MPTTDKLHPPEKPNVFGFPTGLLGMVAGWIMGQTGQEHNEWAVSKLDVAPGDTVLEIGSGPGVGVRLLTERATSGFVAGIDPSHVMLRQARRRNAALIQAGRVELLEGNVSVLPFGDHRFDKVVSVNNIMMWPDLHSDLREVSRVLRPGGLLVISLCPRWANTTDDVRTMGQEIMDHVTKAGFVDAKAELRTDLKPCGAVAVSARVPDTV
jgi:ubiquinone/menaquinone biosynthesis C-methylase UbiE